MAFTVLAQIVVFCHSDAWCEEHYAQNRVKIYLKVVLGSNPGQCKKAELSLGST